MIWLVLGLLVAVTFAVLAFVLGLPRRSWEMVGAALLLGVAGYAMQGSPGLAGAPKTAQERIEGNPAALVAERRKLSEATAGQPGQWLVVADALARHGQYADAAGVLQGAVEANSKDADAWLAMGSALVGHAEGTLSPAALHAFRKAAEADPAHPGPPFFLGMALIQSGRIDEGRALWADLLSRSPADAPWQADLAARLGQLDALIAGQQRTETGR